MLTCWACRHYRARIYGGCAIHMPGYPSAGGSCPQYKRDEAGTDESEALIDNQGFVSFESDAKKS